MREPVRNKRQMYSLLSQGAFGNTIRQYFDLVEWQSCPYAQSIYLWGVRTLTPGGPCLLYCPRGAVPATVRQYEDRGHRVNLSVMIDDLVRVTLLADIYDSPTGLLVYGIEYPPQGASWRALMPSQGKQHTGLAAHNLLRRHLNECSLADLEALRENYSGHVYELSACDRPFGTVPGRNAVLWECRRY